MALKTDFDRQAALRVLTYALGGAVVGMLPGAAVVSATGDRLVNNALGLALLATGGIVGALIGAGVAATGSIVAAIKSRGTGPGNVTRLKDYQRPKGLPPVPPPTRPEAKKAAPPSKSEPVVPAAVPMTAPPLPTAAPRQAEPPEFEDYDRPGAGNIS
jgi:hypothetical protein